MPRLILTPFCVFVGLLATFPITKVAASPGADNKAWKEARPAQVTVAEADMVAEVRKILARHQ